MPEHILVCVAWPYAAGYLHAGGIAGAYLPADVFGRYHRAKGNLVLMVSGSDQHGTPITVTAEQEGRSPKEVAEFYHESFLESWQKLGISYDLFTKTETENHKQVAHDIFLTLLNKGYIHKEVMQSLYCERCHRYLPDRYVEGKCPYCGAPGARGDQCDVCGKPLNSIDLLEPHCRFCGHTPEIRDTEHFFLDLGAFEARLRAWVDRQAHWRPNVRAFTLNILNSGLRSRPITRDIDWGISVPLPGFESKRIYVWFEAVIGYLSASIEWAQRQGQPEKWREWWQQEAKTYYFIGKDNIFFHTVIWPAMLMGHGDYNLPYDVPANEFLNLEGQKISKSRHWGVWIPDYLSRYEPDPLRYYLAANAPETSDSDFTWREFVRRNNDELVATYGNLVHRVLTFTYRNFDRQVPKPANLEEADKAMLDRARATLTVVDGLLAGCQFKAALREIMGLAQEANRYLDARAPWKQIKADRPAAATSLFVALQVINALKLLFYPFLPFSSQRLQGYLGYNEPIGPGDWRWSELPAGQVLRDPTPLFKKLDETLAEEEVARLGK
ncbi:MAG: methionine--tRNA ligase [Chloroflexota bacterium]